MENIVVVPLEDLMNWGKMTVAGTTNIAGDHKIAEMKVPKGGVVSYTHNYDPFKQGKDKPKKLDLMDLMTEGTMTVAGTARIAGNHKIGQMNVPRGGAVSYTHNYDPFAEGKDRPRMLLLI